MSEFEKSPTPRPLIRPGRCRRNFWSPRSFLRGGGRPVPALPSAEGLVTVKPPSGFLVLARAKGGGNPLGTETRVAVWLPRCYQPSQCQDEPGALAAILDHRVGARLDLLGICSAWSRAGLLISGSSTEFERAERCSDSRDVLFRSERYSGRMPRPRNERQALEEERDVELPAKLAKYRRDLDAIPATDETRREFVEWQIRFAEKRMTDVCGRLARGVGREADGGE